MAPDSSFCRQSAPATHADHARITILVAFKNKKLSHDFQIVHKFFHEKHRMTEPILHQILEFTHFTAIKRKPQQTKTLLPFSLFQF